MATRVVMGMALLALVTSGCSLSVSSGSASKASESSSDSSASGSESSGASSDSSRTSSESSGGGTEEEEDVAYRDDVRDETVLYVTSDDDLEAFQTTLTDVARRHGIVDWEASRATYVGIGQGLALANVRGDELAALEHRLAGSDPERRDAMRAGYRSAAR